jgi:hypothetical protein
LAVAGEAVGGGPVDFLGHCCGCVVCVCLCVVRFGGGCEGRWLIKYVCVRERW